VTVNDKAVEAAANAMVIASPDLSGWDDLNQAEIDWYMRDAREALEAAAPYIQAQALRDAAEDLYSYRGRITTMEGAVTWIRDRADELEAGSD
jgi:uncharacterized protein with gpF-like domain